MTALINKKCVPCEGGTTPLTFNQIQDYLKLVPSWTLAANSQTINRTITFNGFTTAIKFINQLAELAESEGHHPNFTLHDWNQVDIELATHALGGLSENDFILAAKINDLIDTQSTSN